jgi:hypothetical protein
MGTLTRVAMCGAEDATVHAPPLAWHPCVSIHYTTTVSDRTSRAHALADWWVRGGGATLRADATVVLLEAHSVVMRPPRMWAQVGVANTRVAAEGEVSMRWWTAAKATMLGAPTDAAASARVDAVDASLVVLRARDWRQLAPEWALFLDALLRVRVLEHERPSTLVSLIPQPASDLRVQAERQVSYCTCWHFKATEALPHPLLVRSQASL